MKQMVTKPIIRFNIQDAELVAKYPPQWYAPKEQSNG